jgi:hypothetical protein
MITHYPQGTQLGNTKNSIQIGYHNNSHTDVVLPTDTHWGILDWNSAKGVFTESDFEHFCNSVDHVLLYSKEEFWPWNPVIQGVCHSMLDILSNYEYSVLYMCADHDRVSALGVHSTWQPWFCRASIPLLAVENNHLDKDYDFLSLIGRANSSRDRVDNYLSENTNSLQTYHGRRPGSLLDYDIKLKNGAWNHNNLHYTHDAFKHQVMIDSIYSGDDVIDRVCVHPVELYNQTHMDIIVETHPRDELHQFKNCLLTEKTARSLSAGRLFRSLGHKGYLHELIRCGLTPLSIWRSDHDTGDQADCFNSFYSDVQEYTGNDFDMLYAECEQELQHNKQVYWYLIKNYPNAVHRHFELIK